MSLTPRVHASATQRDPWDVGVGVQHQHFAGIPVSVPGGLQIEPVLKELCRILNAQVQDCVFCTSVRNAVAIQHGMNDTLVSKVTPMFERSDLSDEIKAALRLTNYYVSSPGDMTDEVWDECRRYYSEDELLELVLLAMYTGTNKVKVTLGFDPGAIDTPVYPTDHYFKSSPALQSAIADLEERGISTSAKSAS